MNLSEWIDEHPIVAVFLILGIVSVLAEVLRTWLASFRRDDLPPGRLPRKRHILNRLEVWSAMPIAFSLFRCLDATRSVHAAMSDQVKEGAHEALIMLWGIVAVLLTIMFAGFLCVQKRYDRERYRAQGDKLPLLTRIGLPILGLGLVFTAWGLVIPAMSVNNKIMSQESKPR